MPDPAQYDDKDEFIADCISERQRENPDESTDQSFAVCNNMWESRSMPDVQRKTPEWPVVKAGEALSVGEREAVFIASTSNPDRIGDVVEQNWDLKDFRKNPVLLFQHESNNFPIGKVPKIWTSGDKTYARVEGTPEGLDERADKVWRFIKHGFLNAVSVGFMPVDSPRERMDKDGRFLGWIFPKNALLELSVVSVPANQEALAVARSYDFTQRDLDEVFVKPKSVYAGVKAAHRFAEIERLRVRR